MRGCGIKRKMNKYYSDKDDNKFVDCAIAANAILVTEDAHFNVLREVRFPQVELLNLQDFQERLFTKRADAW